MTDAERAGDVTLDRAARGLMGADVPLDGAGVNAVRYTPAGWDICTVTLYGALRELTFTCWSGGQHVFDRCVEMAANAGMVRLFDIEETDMRDDAPPGKEAAWARPDWWGGR